LKTIGVNITAQIDKLWLSQFQTVHIFTTSRYINVISSICVN